MISDGLGCGYDSPAAVYGNFNQISWPWPGGRPPGLNKVKCRAVAGQIKEPVVGPADPALAPAEVPT